MHPHLACLNRACGATFDIREVLYNCTKCGGLLEARYDFAKADTGAWKKTWRERRLDNAFLAQSGVWRYREMFPFLDDLSQAVTLREGNTPLLNAPRAAAYGGLARLTFKHQGFNPTGSFKDNGMTCGVAQARRLGMKRVACVSTGNTSASMAAYASAGGLEPLIFIPHGNISYGKLAQALEYGAKTFQVEANFDQILALVRVLAERLGIYLLNSINPFRIEGQKSIVIEMLDQRGWKAPDWIVLPGGNLGNVSALGKGLRELREVGLIERLPRVAVVQAEGASPFYEYMATGGAAAFRAQAHPETLATAIKIGDPISWPKAQFEIEATNSRAKAGKFSSSHPLATSVPPRRNETPVRHQQHADDPLDGSEMRAKRFHEGDERFHRQRGQQEWNAEPERINAQQKCAFRDRALGPGDREDRRQDRPDARRPPERESEPHEVRAPQAERLADREALLAIQEGEPERTEEVQAHPDDREAGDRRQE